MVVTEVVALSVMLLTLPDHVIGRVFGLVDSTLVAAVLIGSLVAGPIITTVGLPVAMVASVRCSPSSRRREVGGGRRPGGARGQA